MGKSKRSKRNRRKSKHNIKVDISQLTKEESNDRQEGGKLNEHKSSGSNIEDEETCSGDNSLCSNLTSETNDLDNAEDLIDEELLPVDPEEFKEHSDGDKLEDCVGCDNKEDKMYGALLLSDPTCSVLKYNEFIEDKICQILGDDDGLNETCDEINKVEMLRVSENDMNIEEMLDDSIHSVLHEKVIMNDDNSRNVENDTFTDFHTLKNEDESEDSNIPMLKNLNNLHSDNYHIVKPEFTNENDVVVSEASEDIFESFDNSLDIELDESMAPKKDNEVQIKLDIEKKINNQNNVINIICDSSKEKLCVLNEVSPSKSSLRNNFSASENSLSDIYYDADQSNDVDTNNKPIPFIKIVVGNQLSISSAIFDKHIGQISDCNQNVVCDEELDKPVDKNDVDRNVNDDIDGDSLEFKSDEINRNLVFDTEMTINEHETVNKQSTTDKIKQGIITPLLKRRSKKSKNKNKQADGKESSENVPSNLKKGSFIFNSFKKRKSSKTDMPDAMERNLERSSSRSSLYKLTEDEVVDSNTEEKNNTYDIFTHNSKNVINSEKSSSVSDLSSVGEKKPIRKLSFIRQLLNSKTYSVNDLPSVGEDKLTKKPSFLERSKRMLTSELFKNQSTNLRRTTSCRDVTDCSIKTRTRLSDTKRMDWSSSLQSLQEDRVVSAVSSHTNLVPEHDSVDEEDEIDLTKTRCDDFSVPALKRTQSCSSSSVGRRCGALHSSAVARNYSSNLDLSTPLDTPLPSYKYIGQDDESHRIPQIQRGNEAEANEKYCSTNNTDQGGNYVNALRFKTTSVDESVRSRSLTHLDNLDPSLLRSGSGMSGVDSGGGGVSVTAASTPCGGSDMGAVGDHPVPSPGVGSAVTLKDALSEPDCSTRFFRPSQPLLMVPPPTPLRTSPSANSTAAMKRFMMSQSQVSSSEYFSVYFDIDTDDSYPIFGREEYLPGCKGVSLFDALGAACERRGVELGACDIYLDGERLPPQMMAAETTELGRRQLRLIPKDLNKPPRLKATSSLNYKTKGGRFFSHSTEDTTLTPNANIVPSFDNRLSNLQDGEKKGKQRWSGFFSNNKDVKMESLVDHLNNYSRHGIPCFDKNSTTTLNTEAPYDVEDDWRCLMDGINFTEKQQQQQTALWELITTEVAYIRMLKVVKDLFLACLQSLQSSNILTEISTTKLFSNIMEIHATNAFFWREHIYPMLHQIRVSHTPLKPEFLEQGFARFRDIFEPYTKYCSDQAKCQMYCREMHSQNNYFKAYLAWCETQKECNRLQLMDILVRPMQRLTKYGLLLKVIYKNSDLEEQKDSLTTMIRSVDEFVNSVNSTLKYKQDSESLCRMMSRIESYDLVDSKDDDLERIVQKYNELDLSMPMLGCSIDRRRHLLAEDDFKLRDSTTSKMEIHSVLLTDLLLICKTSTKKGANGIRVIRQPYIVDRLVVETSRDNLHCVYLNEFKMAVAAFSLQGDSKKVKNWYEHIRKAQTLYRQAKQASAPVVRQQSVNEPDPVDMGLELTTTSEAGDGHSLLGLSLIQRSPLATSSRASRVSSLAHSHSGSVEMNESSVGSVNNQSRAVSVETDQRTASISSDEGVQSLPNENMQKSPMATKSSLKHRLLNPKVSTPNTLSVQPYGNLGQSLPNLTLGSPNTGTIGFVSPSQNTLSVPSTKNTQNLLSPNNRGISYPPPSPTRANLRRGFAIMQPSNKNPPLLKTRHISSTANAIHSGPTSIDIDVPLISGISPPDEALSTTNDGQAIYKKMNRTDNRKHHTAGIVDDLKKDNVHGQETIKRLSWNYSRDQTKEDQCST